MNDVEQVVMCGVREYSEEMKVYLDKSCENDRVVIRAYNEAGFNCTQVDLLDLLKWASENKPELYIGFVTGSMMRDYT